MKISTKHLSALLLMVGFTSTAAFADCSGEYDYAHCSYMMGAAPSGLSGKYIKAQGSNFSEVRCATSDSDFIFATKEKVAPYLKVGQNKITFSACTDSTGKNCDVIATDIFVITGSAGSYSSQPSTFGFDVSSVMTNNKYQTCSFAKHKVNIDR